LFVFSFVVEKEGYLGSKVTLSPSVRLFLNIWLRILAFIRLMLRSRYRSTTVLDSHPYRLVLILKIGFPINE